MKANKKHKKIESSEKEVIEENKELVECKAQNEALKQNYLRALADYKNLEHRMNEERYRMRNSVKREFVTQLLPILDNLDQAEVFNSDPGLSMVRSLFQKSFQNLGVNEMDLLGTEFDPAVAEAVEVVAGKQDNIVVEVLQKAYQIDGSVIRHGKVKVSKKMEH